MNKSMSELTTVSMSTSEGERNDADRALPRRQRNMSEKLPSAQFTRRTPVLGLDQGICERATGVDSVVNEDSERANNAEISQARKSCHVFAIHGLGGRAAWFGRLAKELAPYGIQIHALDLTGFGDSPNRGHVNSYIDWLSACQSYYQELKKQYPGESITILGHSMGGVIASNLYEIFPEDKLILSVPGYKGAKSTFNPLFVLNVFLTLFLDTYIRRSPSYLTLPVSEKSEADPSEEDPLKVREVSPNLLWQLLLLTKLSRKNIQKIQVPVLMIQIEGDKVVDNEEMTRLFNLIPSKSKTLKAFSNTDHDWIWYSKVSLVAKEIAEWINFF